MICEPAVSQRPQTKFRKFSDQISKILLPKKTVNLHYLIYIIYVGTNNNRIDHCIS